MNISLLLTTAALSLTSTLASAEGTTDARHGDHPAVVVQRLYAQRTYDYASKFYAHPAMLYLPSDAPQPAADPVAPALQPRDRDALEQGVPVARLPSHEAATN